MTSGSDPYVLLLLGLLFFSISAASTFSGQTLSRGQGWVYRDKEPTVF